MAATNELLQPSTLKYFPIFNLKWSKDATFDLQALMPGKKDRKQVIDKIEIVSSS